MEEWEASQEAYLINLKKTIGEFFDEPRKLEDFSRFLPKSEVYGWGVSIYPIEINQEKYTKTSFRIDVPEGWGLNLYYEFLMIPEETILESRIFAARVYHYSDEGKVRFYLEGSSTCSEKFERGISTSKK